ncbi:MAG: hypothetical protein KDD11_21495 [Acidobacteria bacterium]|nr:hypothetical protein [Acidobacteriota bacterium]
MTDEELRQALRQLPRERAGDHFTTRLLERLPAADTRRSLRRGSFRGWAPLAAGALALAMAFALGLHRDPPVLPAGVPAARSPEAALAEPTTVAPEIDRALDPPPATFEAPDTRKPIVMANRVPTRGVEAGGRSARIESLLAEQLRLRDELSELRRIVDRDEPMLLLEGDNGLGLLVPVGDTVERARGNRRGAPPVRVVPARLTTF